MRKPRRIALAYQIALPHQERITRGILNYAGHQGLWEFAFSPEASAVSLESLADWQGDGVLAMIETPEQLKRARKLRAPVVNLSGALRDAVFPRVSSDDRQIGRLAAEHFSKKGFRRFAFYGLENVWYSQQRLAGFEQCLTSTGGQLQVLLATSSLHARRPWMWDRSELESWLATLSPPVGLLAAHDYRARMVVESCHRLGLKVPRDVAVIGVNDDPIACESSTPPLSSVAQDGEQMGFEAARMLDRLMAGRRLASAWIEVPPKWLVPRGSTDALGLGDPILIRASELIEKQLADGCNVAQIAGALDVSRRWLERLFKDHLQSTPHAFITQARVDKACELLASRPGIRLQELAALCGFRDVRRLNVAFQRFVGQSPRQYQRSRRSSHMPVNSRHDST